MNIFWALLFLTGIVTLSSLIVAYTYSNKIYLNMEYKKESVSSYTLKILAENPRVYITSLKLGNGIFLTLFTFQLLKIFKTSFQNIINNQGYTFFVIFFIILLVTIQYTFARFIPQTFVKPYANQILIKFDVLIRFILVLLTPLARPLITLSDFLLRKIWNLNQNKDVQLLSIGDLGSYISEQMESAEKQEEVDTELQILKNALAFKDVKAREAMTPRVEIEAIAIDSDIETAKNRFTDTGFSKLMIYEGNTENIIGYIHLFDILKNPSSIRDIIHPIEIITESTFIKELFKNLSVKRKSVAIVVDEYGGLSGMITIEDIIEELFGDIIDEHDDVVEKTEKQIAENHFIFSARLEVSYLNEKYHLGIPESEDYNSLGGYIIFHRNNIPPKDTIIKIQNKQFKIVSCTDKKIEVIELILL